MSIPRYGGQCEYLPKETIFRVTYICGSIPTVLLAAGYFTRKWYLARRLRVHGIGKGGTTRAFASTLISNNTLLCSTGLPNERQANTHHT